MFDETGVEIGVEMGGEAEDDVADVVLVISPSFLFPSPKEITAVNRP